MSIWMFLLACLAFFGIGAIVGRGSAPRAKSTTKPAPEKEG